MSRPCPGSGTDALGYDHDRLLVEDVDLEALADQHGTPLYVYSRRTLVDRFTRLRHAFGADAHICYAVKANPNLSLLRLFGGLGAGFDLVSGGELLRLTAAGVEPSRAVFAGVAKEAWEVEAALQAGILLFNIESPHELGMLAAAGARSSRRVPVALRINPDIDAGTHSYISTGKSTNKFGVGLHAAGEVVAAIAREPWLELVGYHVHLGSQLKQKDSYLLAFARVREFMAGAPERSSGVRHYDLGGGFGIGYGSGDDLDVAGLAAALLPGLREAGLRPILEPGRFLVADGGVLVTRVLGRKDSGAARFLLVDAAMNDLLRPALYQAEHPIVPVGQAGDLETVDVVGPVCESGDFLARRRTLPAVPVGGLLCVLAAGAYGMSMASNYNSRRRPAEVLVDGPTARLIRQREAFAQLWANEVIE